MRERMTYKQEKELAQIRIYDMVDYMQTVPMSYGELVTYQAELERLAKRYGLITELKENGIL